METRELTDMTAVLRSINDGNPSNAERWVTLTQRVVRAETRANAAERAAARKDWEKQNAEYDSWQSNYRAEVAQQEAAKAQDKAARWEVLALTMAAALVLTLSIAAQLGLAFECKSPAVNNEKFCERCAAAFLSAQMPNTGRVKKPWTHQ